MDSHEMSNSIMIQNITKVFGSFTSLGGISLQIKRGEVFGLLGPNGAGKTTLLNIICGLSKPTSGEISILGMKYRNRGNEIKKKIGYVSQETALYEHLTAEENLMFHARFYGVQASERKKRVDQALELAQLEKRRRSRVSEFSGGMKRRLAIVRALLHEPDIILLDEPSLGVDIQSRMEIWNRVKELGKDKIVIVTTNYMEEADYLCEKLAVIDRGRLMAEGSPSGLKKSHLGEVVGFTVKMAPKLTLEDLHVIFKDITTNLQAAELTERGRDWVKVAFRVPNASSKIAGIINLVQNSGSEIGEINVSEPSLNDVFIELTGKELRG